MAEMCRTPSPPIATGSCGPDESLTDSSAGQHIDHLRSRAAGSSGAPRHLTLVFVLRPCGLRREDRWKETQDQHHGKGDERCRPDHRTYDQP